jgi:TetR/AcrR family acrAB operon transcriptional repressor
MYTIGDKTMRRTKEEAAITRQKILKAALAVFSSKGYSATTLEDVALQAGITRGAIYWHFGSKGELYTALVEEYASRGSTIVQQASSEGGTFRQVLRRIFTRQLEAIEEDPELRAMMELTLFKIELTAEVKTSLQGQAEANRALVESITAAMRMGIQGGELRPDIDPLQMALAFLAFQKGAVYLWLLDPAAFSLKASAHSLADILIAGLSAQ